MPLHPRALPAGFIEPCLPTSAKQAPSGAEWLHEIKHDGFRVIARKAPAVKREGKLSIIPILLQGAT
jgi:ATP-dependent DNA ligase